MLEVISTKMLKECFPIHSNGDVTHLYPCTSTYYIAQLEGKCRNSTVLVPYQLKNYLLMCTIAGTNSTIWFYGA